MAACGFNRPLTISARGLGLPDVGGHSMNRGGVGVRPARAGACNAACRTTVPPWLAIGTEDKRIATHRAAQMTRHPRRGVRILTRGLGLTRRDAMGIHLARGSFLPLFPRAQPRRGPVADEKYR